MSAEIRTMLEDMTGVGEDKDYIVKMFEKLEKENKKLQEKIKYWKNFALLYWSGDNLGEGDAGGCEVWQEALDKMNDSLGRFDDQREELTKKCMECDY